MTRCKGLKADGKRCRAPASIVDEDGWCQAHSADGARSEVMAERGRLGGEALRRKYRAKGLTEDELGPLESVQDAQRWLRVVATAVGASRITHQQGDSIIKAIREWLRADGAVTAEQLREIKALADEVKRQRLKVVR